ncbi:hypothetical protein E2C01_081832 [Portunus trituberculatus]|uniref:Uncharacterized protein n=1 Tax=Portunus trituberculatus TaxID=210409 RepID=A0A5B7IZX6_PORTR|nr:hypothetical protein [Portunus trituberculatus]
MMAVRNEATLSTSAALSSVAGTRCRCILLHLRMQLFKSWTSY